MASSVADRFLHRRAWADIEAQAAFVVGMYRQADRESRKKLYMSQVEKGQLKNVDEATIDAALDISEKFSQWILIRVSQGNIKLPDQAAEVKQALDQFAVVAAGGNFTGSKDLMTYKTFEQLKEVVGKAEVGNKTQEKQQTEEGQRVVGQSGPWTVIEITTPEAAAKLCRGKVWCVKDPEYSETYLEQGPLYLVLQNGKSVLMYSVLDGFSDLNNTTVKVNDPTLISLFHNLLGTAMPVNIDTAHTYFNLEGWNDPRGIAVGQWISIPDPYAKNLHLPADTPLKVVAISRTPIAYGIMINATITVDSSKYTSNPYTLLWHGIVPTFKVVNRKFEGTGIMPKVGDYVVINNVRGLSPSWLRKVTDAPRVVLRVEGTDAVQNASNPFAASPTTNIDPHFVVRSDDPDTLVKIFIYSAQYEIIPKEQAYERWPALKPKPATGAPGSTEEKTPKLTPVTDPKSQIHVGTQVVLDKVSEATSLIGIAQEVTETTVRFVWKNEHDNRPQGSSIWNLNVLPGWERVQIMSEGAAPTDAPAAESAPAKKPTQSKYKVGDQLQYVGKDRNKQGKTVTIEKINDGAYYYGTGLIGEGRSGFLGTKRTIENPAIWKLKSQPKKAQLSDPSYSMSESREYHPSAQTIAPGQPEAPMECNPDGTFKVDIEPGKETNLKKIIPKLYVNEDPSTIYEEVQQIKPVGETMDKQSMMERITRAKAYLDSGQIPHFILASRILVSCIDDVKQATAARTAQKESDYVQALAKDLLNAFTDLDTAIEDYASHVDYESSQESGLYADLQGKAGAVGSRLSDLLRNLHVENNMPNVYSMVKAQYMNPVMVPIFERGYVNVKPHPLGQNRLVGVDLGDQTVLSNVIGKVSFTVGEYDQVLRKLGGWGLGLENSGPVAVQQAPAPAAPQQAAAPLVSGPAPTLPPPPSQLGKQAQSSLPYGKCVACGKPTLVTDKVTTPTRCDACKAKAAAEGNPMRLSSFQKVATAEEAGPVHSFEARRKRALDYWKRVTQKDTNPNAPEGTVLLNEKVDNPQDPAQTTRSPYSASRIAEQIMMETARGFFLTVQEAFNGYIKYGWKYASPDQKTELARILRSYGHDIEYDPKDGLEVGKVQITAQKQEAPVDETAAAIRTAAKEVRGQMHIVEPLSAEWVGKPLASVNDKPHVLVDHLMSVLNLAMPQEEFVALDQEAAKAEGSPEAENDFADKLLELAADAAPADSYFGAKGDEYGFWEKSGEREAPLGEDPIKLQTSKEFAQQPPSPESVAPTGKTSEALKTALTNVREAAVTSYIDEAADLVELAEELSRAVEIAEQLESKE